MAKIPANVRLQIARVTSKDIWEIDELLQVLRTEVEAREISEGVKVYALPTCPIHRSLLETHLQC